jgi:hypothetical protein
MRDPHMLLQALFRPDLVHACVKERLPAGQRCEVYGEIPRHVRLDPVLLRAQ